MFNFVHTLCVKFVCKMMKISDIISLIINETCYTIFISFSCAVYVYINSRSVENNIYCYKNNTLIDIQV